MRYLGFAEAIELHQRILAESGGSDGVRDLGALESALAQPKVSVGGVDAYQTLVEKAAALCFSLASNHPFFDGNKRVAHAAMEVFLLLNSAEIDASTDDQERLMLKLASGQLRRHELVAWLQAHVQNLEV